MSTRFYTALIERGEDGYGVVFPDLPGCVSAGRTVDDAAHGAVEALALHLTGMIEDGDPLPDPGPADAPLPDWLADAEAEIVARVLVPAPLPDEAGGGTVRISVALPTETVRRIDRLGGDRARFLTEAVEAALR